MGTYVGSLPVTSGYVGALPVLRTYVGAVLVWSPDAAVPDALDTGDWSISAVAVGPTLAEVIVNIPEANASAVRWWNGVGAPWNSAVNVGGGNWRLIASNGNPLTVADGTHSGFKISYQQEGTDWSPESVDTKSVTFDEATITPTEATVTINLTAGVVRAYDVVAEGVFTASPPWPMAFRVTSGTDEIPHQWDGSTVTWYPEHDETSGDRTIVITAYWQGEDPVVEFGTPPANTVAPVLSGGAAVGETGSVTTGTWSGSNLSYYYRWRVNGDLVSGATIPTRVFGANESTVAEIRAVSRISTGVYAFGPWVASNMVTTKVPLTFDNTTVTFDSTQRTFDEETVA